VWFRALVAAIVVALLGAADASAAFPGRDGRIAFVAQVGCGRYSEGDACAALGYSALITIAPGGGHPNALARCPGPRCLQGLGRHALWSPDGSLLAVDVVTEGSARIAILTADGALLRSLAVVGEPVSWLPDGRRLAVLRGDRVFVLAVAGGRARVVGGPHGARVWSVRGDVAIAHPTGIMVWRATTGRRRRVLTAGERYSFGRPDWSPDGRRVAVVRTDLLTRLATIVTVPASGGHARVVVRGPTPGCLLGDPVWSPAGSRIAFASTCLDETRGDDAPSMYAVRPDGARLRRLFNPLALAPPSAPVERYVSAVLSWQARP
jgi:dipeptidyl aminopeptidase/acylaminoacyl peptidase